MPFHSSRAVDLQRLLFVRPALADVVVRAHRDPVTCTKLPRRYSRSCALLGLLILAGAADAAEREEPIAGPDAAPVLGAVWDFAREHIYPPDLSARFDDGTRAELSRRLDRGDAPLADVLNPFLRSLGVSHTEFFDIRHESYYLLKSMFGTRNFDLPALDVIGIQSDGEDIGRVRAVLDGLAADRAGILPGDRIVRVDGRPFRSLLDWQSVESVVIDYERRGALHTVEIRPERMSMPRALLEATRNSRQEYRCADARISYLHLWSGTDDAYLEVLVDAVAGAGDAFILDLRDGYGGAWWAYLDPFFTDRASYFTAEILDRSGASEPMRAEPKANPGAFTGPLAVLVNSGTRSGKESLAHQFKRSGRGRLIGTPTAGAFTAGQGVFADRDGGYLLYMSVAEYRLDGVAIEGVGVTPDVLVEPVPGSDAALAAALDHLGCPGQAAGDGLLVQSSPRSARASSSSR